MFVWNSTHLTPINGAVQNSTISQQHHHHPTTTLRDILNQKGGKNSCPGSLTGKTLNFIIIFDFSSWFNVMSIFVNNNIFCPFFIGNVPMCTSTVFLAHFDSTTKESKRVPSFYFFPRSTRFWKSDSWCFHVFFLGFAAAIPCKPRIPRCCGSSI